MSKKGKIDYEKIKSDVFAFIEKAQVLIEENDMLETRFHESISTNKRNMDRHFTTFSNFELEVSHVELRFSGARIMFIDDRYLYEISLDLLIEFEEIAENEYLFVEMYSEDVYRESRIVFDL